MRLDKQRRIVGQRAARLGYVPTALRRRVSLRRGSTLIRRRRHISATDGLDLSRAHGAADNGALLLRLRATGVGPCGARRLTVGIRFVLPATGVGTPTLGD